MTQREIILLMSYIRNNTDRLEDEVRQLQENVRYRKFDAYDCTELTCAIERLNIFRQTTSDIRNLLGLYGKKSESFCIYCLKCLFLGAECEGFRCGLSSCEGDACAYEKDFAWCFTPRNKKTGE